MTDVEAGAERIPRLRIENKLFESSFAIDRAKLLRIVGIVGEQFAAIQLPFESAFTVRLRDGRTIRERSLDALLALDNTVRNPITALMIRMGDAGGRANEVTLQYAHTEFYHVLLRVEGIDAHWVSGTFAELEEQVERSLQTQFVYRFRRGILAFLVLIPVVCFALLLILLGLSLPRRTTESLIGPFSWLRPADVVELKEMAQESETTEEKVDFLFEVYRRQIERQPVQDPSPEVRIVLNLRGLLLVLPFVIAYVCALYNVVFCYPADLFLWGDYEQHYSTLVTRRGWLWNAVISTLGLGLVGNLFATAIGPLI